MSVYDSKTRGVIESNGRFVLPDLNPCDDMIFKASYIVASDIACNGKIDALFDLTVLGDVTAAELNVKGKFVCTGKCVIDGSLIATDILVNDVRAEAIESRDRIVAQEIDTDIIKADSNIVVGKCLAVEKLATGGNNIVCGETVYGAGKVVASKVITGEAIDLDDGADAIVNPNVYQPNLGKLPISSQSNHSVSETKPDFLLAGNWVGYIAWLIENSIVKSEKDRFESWKNTVSKVDGLVRDNVSSCRDLILFIKMTGIVQSDYFHGWTQLHDLQKALDKHFSYVANTDKSSIICSLESYSELLQVLDILNRYGDSMDRTTYGVAFEMLVSNFGLKAKFMTERLNEKGWYAHGEQ